MLNKMLLFLFLSCSLIAIGSEGAENGGEQGNGQYTIPRSNPIDIPQSNDGGQNQSRNGSRSVGAESAEQEQQRLAAEMQRAKREEELIKLSLACAYPGHPSSLVRHLSTPKVEDPYDDDFFPSKSRSVRPLPLSKSAPR